MTFELTLTDHPAIARHPIRKNEQLMDENGKPVPLLPDQKAIRMAGVMIGYVLPGNKISLIRPASQLTAPVVKAIEELVAAESGKEVAQVKAVSKPKKPKAVKGGDE